jgi:hypothetical protein
VTRLTLLTTTLILFATGPSVQAGADCGDAPKETWMSRADMQAKILAAGYTIDRFKVDDDCYEVYGRNSDDNKVEVYFNPVTGDIVKEEVAD